MPSPKFKRIRNGDNYEFQFIDNPDREFQYKLSFINYPVQLKQLNRSYYKKTILDALKPVMTELDVKVVNGFTFFERRSDWSSNLALANDLLYIGIQFTEYKRDEEVCIYVYCRFEDDDDKVIANSVERRRLKLGVNKVLRKLSSVLNTFIKDGNMMMSSPLRSKTNMFLGPAEKTIGQFLGIKLGMKKKPTFLNGGKKHQSRSKGGKKH